VLCLWFRCLYGPGPSCNNFIELAVVRALASGLAFPSSPSPITIVNEQVTAKRRGLLSLDR